MNKAIQIHHTIIQFHMTILPNTEQERSGLIVSNVMARANVNTVTEQDATGMAMNILHV